MRTLALLLFIMALSASSPGVSCEAERSMNENGGSRRRTSPKKKIPHQHQPKRETPTKPSPNKKNNGKNSNPFTKAAAPKDGPPIQRRECGSVATFGELEGRVIAHYPKGVKGMNEGQRDRSCCSLCLSDSRCEFWERVGDECSLKRNFIAYSPSSLLESPATNDVAAEGAHGSSGQGNERSAHIPAAETNGFVRWRSDVESGGVERGGNGQPPPPRSGFVSTGHSGVYFLRTGHSLDNGGSGEVLAHLLSEMAFRRGLRVLSARDCYQQRDNPLGASSCRCPRLVALRSLPGKDPAAKLGARADPWVTFPDAAFGPHRYQMVVSAMFYHPDLVDPYLSHSANLRRVMLLRDPLDRVIHAFYVAKARALAASSQSSSPHLFHPGGASGALKSSPFAYADACELSWTDLGRGGVGRPSARGQNDDDDEAQQDETDEEDVVRGGWREIPAADAATRAFHPSWQARRDDTMESVAFVNWLRRCPLATKGFYSDFHYLDPGNFEKLNAFIENRTRHLNKLHAAAASNKKGPSAAQLQADGNNHPSGHRKHANANAKQQLHQHHQHRRRLSSRFAETFSAVFQRVFEETTSRAAARLRSPTMIVGLHSRLDESLLLFETLLGWPREEILYTRSSDAFRADYASFAPPMSLPSVGKARTAEGRKQPGLSPSSPTAGPVYSTRLTVPPPLPRSVLKIVRGGTSSLRHPAPHSPASSSSSSSSFAPAVGVGWRRNETAEFLHAIGSPIRVLQHFYEAVAVPEHERQVRKFLGPREKVRRDVAQFQRQVDLFEPCIEALARASSGGGGGGSGSGGPIGVGPLVGATGLLAPQNSPSPAADRGATGAGALPGSADGHTSAARRAPWEEKKERLSGAAAADSDNAHVEFGTCANPRVLSPAPSAGNAREKHHPNRLMQLAAQSAARYDCTGFLRCQGPDCA